MAPALPHRAEFVSEGFRGERELALTRPRPECDPPPTPGGPASPMEVTACEACTSKDGAGGSKLVPPAIGRRFRRSSKYHLELRAGQICWRAGNAHRDPARPRTGRRRIHDWRRAGRQSAERPQTIAPRVVYTSAPTCANFIH